MKTVQILELHELVGRLAKVKMPAKGSIGVARLMARLQTERDIFERERVKLCESLSSGMGAPDANGRASYEFTPEKRVEFNEQYTGLLDSEVDAPLPKVKVGDLGNAEIEPGLMLALMPVLED